MPPVQRISAGIMMLALAGSVSAQEPIYKFSTTVIGEPLYTFGTTVVATTGFRGEIYHIKPGSRKLPNFSTLKPVGEIYTPYLCVPPRSFDEGFPGVTDRFEWFAIDYTARFWVSEPGKYRFALASDDGSVNLKMGEHAIRVWYFQGPRFQVALVLRVARPDEIGRAS